jgi:hypothetical protein
LDVREAGFLGCLYFSREYLILMIDSSIDDLPLSKMAFKKPWLLLS